jgi:hypothetical protein
MQGGNALPPLAAPMPGVQSLDQFLKRKYYLIEPRPWVCFSSAVTLGFFGL